MQNNNIGPTDRKCKGCQFHEIGKVSKGEKSSDNYCTHQLAPNSLRRLTPLHTSAGAFVGYNDTTPEWCPCKPKSKIKGTTLMSTKNEVRKIR